MGQHWYCLSGGQKDCNVMLKKQSTPLARRTSPQRRGRGQDRASGQSASTFQPSWTQVDFCTLSQADTSSKEFMATTPTPSLAPLACCACFRVSATCAAEARRGFQFSAHPQQHSRRALSSTRIAAMTTRKKSEQEGRKLRGREMPPSTQAGAFCTKRRLACHAASLGCVIL